MGLNEEVQKHVKVTYLGPAKLRGDSTIRIKAGDVHRELHWSNRVPSVCTTLSSKKFQREVGLELVSKEGPPSGFGTRAEFTYRLVVQDGVAPQQSSKRTRLERLYGALSDVFQELGGGENFLSSERKNLNFRKDNDKRADDKDKK